MDCLSIVSNYAIKAHKAAWDEGLSRCLRATSSYHLLDNLHILETSWSNFSLHQPKCRPLLDPQSFNAVFYIWVGRSLSQIKPSYSSKLM